MKSVENTLLGRRSIRRYERQPVEREKLDLIYAAIRNTPTSYNGQQFSVIAVTDQTVKEELYEITGHFTGFLPRLSQAPRGGRRQRHADASVREHDRRLHGRRD